MYRKLGAIFLAVLASQAQVKVDSSQAARLAQDLTPLGAERAGNAEGSIPSWEGGVRPSAGYQPGMHHPDPFPGAQPRLRIAEKDIDGFWPKLPAGLVDLLELHAYYYLQAYPTRRSAASPERIYAATRHNAEHAELIENGNG